MVTLALYGCDFVPQFYDNNEYLLLAEIEASSRLLHDECVDMHVDVLPRINILYERAEVLTTYAFYQPQNDTVTEQVTIIADNISELRNKYRQDGVAPSDAYCKLKAETITVASQRVLSTIGNKTRK